MVVFVKEIEGVEVPRVIDELSNKHILTSELIHGLDLDTCSKELDQEERNRIGEKILDVTLREVFEWKFMQTDPNPANFFYNPISRVLYLIDFGAARDYSDEFVTNYLDTVYAAANGDAKTVLRATTDLGFLSGKESKLMIDAHIEGVLVVGEPFSTPGEFDFGSSTMT